MSIQEVDGFRRFNVYPKGFNIKSSEEDIIVEEKCYYVAYGFSGECYQNSSLGGSGSYEEHTFGKELQLVYPLLSLKYLHFHKQHLNYVLHKS